MSNNSVMNRLLEALHEETAKQLLARVKTGEATAAELTAALRMLKDNGIEAVPTAENPLGQLAEELPEFLEQDELH